MFTCTGCHQVLPREAFGTQAVKFDRRPGRKPRTNVRNSRCLVCDSRAARKGDRMASPSEIVAKWDAKKAVSISPDAPPSGWILVNGQEMAVWLPPGDTPSALGLRTFRKTRVLAA